MKYENCDLLTILNSLVINIKGPLHEYWKENTSISVPEKFLKPSLLTLLACYEITLSQILCSDCRPPLPVLLPASTGQGLQISAQLTKRDGQVFYSLLFENNSQIPLDGFMIQFNKNTFGLAAAGPLQVSIAFMVFTFYWEWNVSMKTNFNRWLVAYQVPLLQPGTSARTLLPMVMFQNMSQGPPSSLLQVAVKNSQQPVWYFNDKISLHIFFTEDGRMERASFLEVYNFHFFDSII